MVSKKGLLQKITHKHIKGKACMYIKNGGKRFSKQV